MRNRTWRCWPALALLALLVMGSLMLRPTPRVAHASDHPPTDASNDDAAPIPADVVGDLLRLRRTPNLELFGKENAFEPLPTQVTELPNSSDKSVGNQELFAAELERLSSPAQGSIALPTIGPDAPAPAPDWTKQPSPALPVGTVQALRAAAFELDKAAHHLECHDLYGRSDQMRALAQQLRQDARIQEEDDARPISFNFSFQR